MLLPWEHELLNGVGIVWEQGEWRWRQAYIPAIERMLAEAANDVELPTGVNAEWSERDGIPVTSLS